MEAAKKWKAAVEDPSKLFDAIAQAKAAAARWKAAAKRLRASVIGGELSDQNHELRRDIEQISNELANAMTREQELWSENKRLKDELAAAPHWVPVSEFENDNGYHIVWSSEIRLFEGRLLPNSNRWHIARTDARRSTEGVTHVLVGLNPPANKEPVSNCDPRGDGDIDEPIVSDADVTLSTEQMADASDTDREIRERLLQPFYGSEAEQLGADKYQLRDVEAWQMLDDGYWDTCYCPVWHPSVQYRLFRHK